ncbi:uncharacterized protein K02A2.6-like [Rhagoletis pomonella]|uniref:uncharacterized protein K02A2.6-like n=1 Tax=Rhagoletis pomonella TaxID=28610 RepID=UPI00177AE743|nr:uncharacterized protein K02A2.6-like [Rhagoletis pomonella]
MGNADCLSRLPVEDKSSKANHGEVLMIEMASSQIVNAKDIAAATAKDPLLMKVTSWALRGWPPSMSRDDEAYAYHVRRNEITTLKGCLLWGNRTIVPSTCRKPILEALHSGHPGIVKMKALARGYFWWPKMDTEVENIVKTCAPCQQTRHEKAQAQPHIWETSKNPWSRLHVDFAGPFHGKIFFLTVDSYSKWLEVHIVKSTSSQCAIKSLRSLFATHGLPDVIVSDNGTAFTSSEFDEFMTNNLIRHVRCAPFHPSSNGQAERMVQTTKDFLKKLPPNSDFELNLVRFVFNQHITPHATTGRSPAELFFNRQLKTYFDKVHPHELSNVKDNPVVKQTFCDADLVWIRNYSTGPKWLKGRIYSRTGPVSYKVRLEDGRVIKRHLDQIRSRAVTEDLEMDSEEVDIGDRNNPDSTSGSTSVDESETNAADLGSTPPASKSPSPTAPASTLPPQTLAPNSPSGSVDRSTPIRQQTPRRSNRPRKVPEFYSSAGR